MCGIFGYVGEGFTTELLLTGIRRLEYRGYDSWGVAIQDNGGMYVHREAGRMPEGLPEDIPTGEGRCGIAHTRWATHGAPTRENAHPHIDCSGDIAIVHNGIIENYKPLRRKMEKLGHTLRTDTDSELAAHLIEEFRHDGLDIRGAFLETLKSIEGTYGLAMINRHEPNRIYLGRMSSPLVIGQGDGFTVVASDPSAIVPYTRYVMYLEDGECGIADADGCECFKLDETPAPKEAEKLTMDLKGIELGGYDYFMEKEIHEQPQSIKDAMRGRIKLTEGTSKLGGFDESLLLKAKRIRIIACGTSLNAGLIGKYMFERMARIPTVVSNAAEFRYAEPVLEPDTLVLAISQSGETADTLAGVREAKRLGAQALGIVNAVGSSIARECGQGVFLHAGPEIGVASTKAFTSQCVVMALLALQMSRQRQMMSLRDGLIFLDALSHLVDQASTALENNDSIRSIAEEFAEFNNFLYVGRLFEFPLAMEGALKLKEISYIHAEGIGAAELKHGPIALVDKNMPVVVLAAQQTILNKMISNVNEIKARGGRIIAVVREGTTEMDTLAERVITIPATIDALVPIIGVIPLQLLAYHVAVLRGCDVDRPRNLAKSVTVE
jgi:glutamine---fructose-6-phosphate transaminase (isomerizing)